MLLAGNDRVDQGGEECKWRRISLDCRSHLRRLSEVRQLTGCDHGPSIDDVARTLHLYRRPNILFAPRILAVFVFFHVATAACNAQELIPSSDIPTVNRLFDSKQTQNTLKCDVQTWSPALDFDFRYQAGLFLIAGMNQFRFGDRVTAYLRVVPEGSAPVFLWQSLKLPSPAPGSEAIRPGDLKHQEITLGNAFNVGEGRYSVEFLFVSQGGGSCYKKWSWSVGNHADKRVPQMMSPGSVTPIVIDSWDGHLDSKGVRLRVLLDAASMRQYSSQLYPWDRSLLLEALASVLKQVPARSVALTAFNLEQQREIFRQEQFDAAGFEKLSKALEGVGLATVPYEALRKGSAPKFLINLTREQVSVDHPAEAVVFLGPLSSVDQNILMQPFDDSGSPRFFYFALHRSGANFPDAIEHLTKNLHGSVFSISTPSELALAIRKMTAQLGQ
jgi:hypothetical protein